MDKFKAFLADKKNTPIVAAVAVIVLVLVVLFYLKQFGIIGGNAPADETIPVDMGTTADTGTMGTTTPAGGTAPTGAVTPPPGGGTATGTSTPAPAAAAYIAKEPPMFAYRKDPFMGFSGPPKKQDALMTILPGIRRMRLAPARLTLPPPDGVEVTEVLPPQPMRRVAGIMWGPTVKAIIESGGKTHLVMPGAQIPGENVRVESIDPSGLTLTTLDTKRPMRIRVNLAGSPTAQDQGDGSNMGNEVPPNNNYNRGSRGSSAPTEAPPPGF